MRNFRIPAFSLVLMCLFPPIANAQTGSVAALTREVDALKEIVQQQSRRIEALERTLATLTGQSTTPSASSRPRQTPGGFKNPSNWDQLKNGMSRQQVIAILGRPTSQSEFGLRLLYEGDIPGSGFVSGYVAVIDNRMIGYGKPVF